MKTSPLAPPDPKRKAMNPLVRLAIEFGPLGVFFGTYTFFNAKTWPLGGLFGPMKQPELMAATATFMVAMLISLAASIRLERRVPLMPLVTGVVVVIFGGLTLLLDSDIFIKMKPTIVNGLFAFALFTGLLFNRAFLKYLFGPVMTLDEIGWRKLSFRWACWFVVLAVINEVVWRTQTTDFWVSFKVFGNMPLTILFALLQMPLIIRHTPAPERASAPNDTAGSEHPPSKPGAQQDDEPRR
jgi:intracellular septation protein